jgi:hypothetical protein
MQRMAKDRIDRTELAGKLVEVAQTAEDPIREIGEMVLCAEQRVVREGSSPSGARMRGAISKSGDNTSLAGESGRYGEA